MKKRFFEIARSFFTFACVVCLMATAATMSRLPSAQAVSKAAPVCAIIPWDEDLCYPGKCPLLTDCYTGPNNNGACCH